MVSVVVCGAFSLLTADRSAAVAGADLFPIAVGFVTVSDVFVVDVAIDANGAVGFVDVTGGAFGVVAVAVGVDVAIAAAVLHSVAMF